MERFLAPILLFVLLLPSLALGETIGDLVEWNGLYYMKFINTPCTNCHDRVAEEFSILIG
jgi:hypothetical protein